MNPANLSRPAPTFKTCTKCAEHISRTQWDAMPCIGLQDDGDGGFLELRNHACGSTLAIILPTAQKAA